MKRITCSVGLILLSTAARAQTGFSGGGSSFGAGELLGAAMLMTFIALIFWGFLSGLVALLPLPSLPPQRRLALRWIGLSRLEPSVTTLLFVVVFVTRLHSEITDSPFPMLWFALPTITFLGTLLPPVWFRSKHDAAVQNTWRGLRSIAVARVAPYLLFGLGLLLEQGWLAIAALVIGLGSLFWSLRVTVRLATQLGTLHPLSQPITKS